MSNLKHGDTFLSDSTTSRGSSMAYQEEMKALKKMSLDYAKFYEPPKKHDEEDEDFDLDKYPVKEWSITLPFLDEPVAFNPITSFIGVACLWGLAIWCMRK